ncbi:ABC transporter C member 13 [Coemansia sp. RSA 1822]|nr:ABC transporter C member 13 [Coemansia sp. RSA 1822]
MLYPHLGIVLDVLVVLAASINFSWARQPWRKFMAAKHIIALCVLDFAMIFSTQAERTAEHTAFMVAALVLAIISLISHRGSSTSMCLHLVRATRIACKPNPLWPMAAAVSTVLHILLAWFMANCHLKQHVKVHVNGILGLQGFTLLFRYYKQQKQLLIENMHSSDSEKAFQEELFNTEFNPNARFFVIRAIILTQWKAITSLVAANVLVGIAIHYRRLVFVNILAKISNQANMDIGDLAIQLIVWQLLACANFAKQYIGFAQNNLSSSISTMLECKALESFTASRTDTFNYWLLDNNIYDLSNNFVTVVGRVGSGKSSLMAALCGEMPIISGQGRLSGRIGFVDQKPTVSDASFRENVLMGNEYEEKWFNQVIYACALTQDLEQMENGDQTEVGYGGVNLSGGQKTRLALARALYLKADVYIFDDLLSAVDAHVERHIIENVLVAGGIIGSKTRILVTHAEHVIPLSDKVVTLTNGQVQVVNQTPLQFSEGLISGKTAQSEDVVVEAQELTEISEPFVIHPDYDDPPLRWTSFKNLRMNLMTDSNPETMVQSLKWYLLINAVVTCRPPKHWPSNGQIEFHKYSMQYTPTSGLVLSNLSFSVGFQEKIGIVGRTGAGKSSLAQAIMRMVEPAAGKIIIDGIDIATIGLHDLRSRISIIPQDPTLFEGTICDNLDPMDEYTDDDVWAAIRATHIEGLLEKPTEKYIEGLYDNDMGVWVEGIGLNKWIKYGGSNFSVGERQLISLCRALLWRRKILILDEATANIDNKTDQLIQTVLRDEFKDCTILTIAHRLNTVMDSDRILVMDQGTVAEFDTPKNLLARDGPFTQLVASMKLNHRELDSNE